MYFYLLVLKSTLVHTCELFATQDKVNIKQINTGKTYSVASSIRLSLCPYQMILDYVFLWFETKILDLNMTSLNKCLDKDCIFF
jgi:hypothetical protein